MPPSFLVDEHGQLVDTFGGVESLLKVKPRRPSQNLLDMLDDELRTVISGALHRVRRDAESVRYPSVPIPGDSRPLLARRRADARPARRADARPHLARRRRRAGGATVAGAAVRRRAARRVARRWPHDAGRPRRPVARSDAGARGRAVVHEGASAGGDPGARDRQRGAAGHQRGADRRRTRSCRARTRSCTRSTRSCTRSTPSTRRRTSSCRS